MTESIIYPYPEHWELTTLGKLCKDGGGAIQTGPFGSQLHASDYVAVGIPSIMPKNISIEGVSTEDIARITEQDAQRLSKYLVKAGDIVYSRRGDVEKCSLITEKENGWLCGTGCLKVSFGQKSKIPSEYIHAYLSHPSVREWISRHAVGATMPNLNTSILSDVPVLIPSEEEIYVILNVWKKTTDKIILNRQTNQTLEHIAQAIFKSWFVDFDPTRAKIDAKQAGEDPERAAMAAISGKTVDELDQLSSAQLEQLKTTAGLFPDALVDSELGEVPEGWTVKPLSKMVQLIGGGTPKKSEGNYWGGDIHWFSVKDAPAESDVFVIGTELKITKLGLSKSSTKLLSEGVTIISARGTVGRLALVGVPTAMNQSCYGVKGINGTGAYLNYLNLKGAVSALQKNTHGAVFDTITRDTFDSVLLVDSPESIKTEFESAVTQSFSLIKSNLFENKYLSDLRDTLLPKLLSGELSTEPTEAVKNG